MHLLLAFIRLGCIVRVRTVAGVAGHLIQLLLSRHVLRGLRRQRVVTLARLAVLLRLERYESTVSERRLRGDFIMAQTWLCHNLLHIRALHLRL